MAVKTDRKRMQRSRRGAPVVAEVLADGSVRMTPTGRRGDRDEPFAIGQLSGEGWILWWQRRRLED
jgi:hypothetical protein